MTIPIGMLGQAGGAIVTKILSGSDYDRAKKMQRLQMEGAKEMTRFNREQQLKMWEDTNYAPQVEQMKKAGLNVGLMFGMGGGGGATTNVNAGNVSGTNTQDTRLDTGMGMQLGAQLELLKAQKENIEADTANKKAGATNTTADTANKEQQLKESTTSFEDRMNTIAVNYEKTIQETQKATNEAVVGRETQEAQIDKAKADAVTALLQDDEIQAKIDKMQADIQQRGEEIAIREFEAELKAMFPSASGVAGGATQTIIDELMRVLKMKNRYDNIPRQIKK